MKMTFVDGTLFRIWATPWPIHAGIRGVGVYPQKNQDDTGLGLGLDATSP